MIDIIPIYQFIILTLLPSYLILRRWDVLILRHCQLVLLKYSGKRTRAQISITAVLFCLGYLALNVILMIPHFSHDSLQRGSIRLAMINVIPLSLFGRMNSVVNFLRIQQGTYLLVLTHAAVLCAAQVVIHSLHKPLNSKTSISGIVAMGCIIACILSKCISSFFYRFSEQSSSGKFLRMSTRVFGGLLPLSITGAITWHLIELSHPLISFPWAAAILSGILWLISQGIKLWNHLRHGRALGMMDSTNQSILKIQLRRPIAARPGYFFIRSPSNVPLRNQPAPMLWWQPTAASISSFAVLMDEPLRLTREERIRVYVDGPYREELYLGKYETVIFVAQGTGISRVMPHLLHLTTRLMRDRSTRADGGRWNIEGLFNDKTRKVDLYWKMDNNDQVSAVHSFFKELSDLNADNYLQAWIFYPQGIPENTLLPPAKAKRHWFPVEGDFVERVSLAIEAQSKRTPGRAVVVSSGLREFRSAIRRSIQSYIKADNLISLQELDTTTSQGSQHFGQKLRRVHA